MAETTNKIVFGGKEFTAEEFAAAYREMEKTYKEKKKEGVIVAAPKAAKAEKVLSPEVQLFIAQIGTVFEANLGLIESLFKATISESLPLGQTGIEYKISDKYAFQLLNREARAKKAAADKEKKAAEKAKAKETAEPAKTE